mmetsp:Transcript_10928/g.17886  ORF Transcript_10928/g.17886 Transcript_10928/m.17886 type:complete len:110 (+) Transcript_10928:783-1112(+)
MTMTNPKRQLFFSRTRVTPLANRPHIDTIDKHMLPHNDQTEQITLIMVFTSSFFLFSSWDLQMKNSSYSAAIVQNVLVLVSGLTSVFTGHLPLCKNRNKNNNFSSSMRI